MEPLFKNGDITYMSELILDIFNCCRRRKMSRIEFAQIIYVVETP